MRKSHELSNRIAFFISSMQGGGAQRGVLKTARGLAERGYAVDLVLSQATGPYMEEIPGCVNVVDLKARSVSSSLPALVGYMRRERPKAFVSALSYVNIIALLAKRIARVPLQLVLGEQNTVSISTHKYLRMRGRLLVPVLVKKLYPWADDLVGVSRGVSDDLATFLGIPKEQVHVIHNPIITPEMKSKAEEHVDHPWFAEGEPPVALAVGRLQHQKDFPTLLEAFAQVRQRQHARLMILGEGPDRAALEQQASALGIADDVALPGFVMNPYAYMAKAGTFVLSSRWEGLPSVLIEALYCGAPLVSTNCPSGPDEILENGAHGCLVPVGNAQALADGISAAFAGQVPRPLADSWRRYDIDHVVDGYVHLLNL